MQLCMVMVGRGLCCLEGIQIKRCNCVCVERYWSGGDRDAYIMLGLWAGKW